MSTSPPSPPPPVQSLTPLDALRAFQSPVHPRRSSSAMGRLYSPGSSGGFDLSERFRIPTIEESAERFTRTAERLLKMLDNPGRYLACSDEVWEQMKNRVSSRTDLPELCTLMDQILRLLPQDGSSLIQTPPPPSMPPSSDPSSGSKESDNGMPASPLTFEFSMAPMSGKSDSEGSSSSKQSSRASSTPSSTPPRSPEYDEYDPADCLERDSGSAPTQRRNTLVPEEDSSSDSDG